MFDKENLLKTATSQYDNYCIGYPGTGGYFTALVLGQGSWPKTYSHAGSDTLDNILAYDRAEIDGAYIGQINMITVSSFCGPEGLIWGYDIARVKYHEPAFLNKEDLLALGDVKIYDGSALREASVAIFGTNDARRFPFLPGSHVPCAGRSKIFEGPTVIYSAIGIGIPKDRGASACVLMEDVGELSFGNGAGELGQMKKRLTLDMARSVLEIGNNQRVKFKEIFIDIGSRKIPAGEVGCALVAMPYFHIAKNALDARLAEMTLDDWVMSKKQYFNKT